MHDLSMWQFWFAPREMCNGYEQPSDVCSQSKRESGLLALPKKWDETIVLDTDAASQILIWIL